MGNTSTKSQNANRTKKSVHWKSAEPPSRPGKPMQIQIPEPATEVIVIKWERPNTDGGSLIIGYLVEQRRVGSPTWTKTSTTLVPYPEITLSCIDPTWRYQFRVFAQNVVGISESSPVSDPISAILQQDGSLAPQFLNELQNMTILENDPCELHVNVLGSPSPQINWFKDGFEIFSSRRTKIINHHGSSTLIFHQVALTDEGEIKCTATNRYGHVVARFQLRIDAPPKIRLPRQYEDGYLVEAGEMIKLKVGIAGRPTPSITWTHNGEIVKNDGRFEITTNDKNSFLKIVKAARSDRGEYNVRALNKLGEFNTSFLVTVTAKPSPPLNVRITMSLGKSVTLMWSPPEDDGGCKVGNYIVEYFRTGWDVWLKASSTRQLTTTLNDLIEGSEYKFRVKAESPYGLSEPSEESKVLFVPDHKRGITTLSPQSKRHGPFNKDRATTKSREINQILIPDVPKNVEFISQVYDNDQIVKELNYGTSINKSSSRKREQTNSKDETISRDEQSMKNNVTTPTTKDTLNLNNNTKKRRANLEDNYDEVHTSSEFMLVLYDEKETGKSSTEPNDFHLDLKESIEAPPLSLSTPDLHDVSHHCSFQPLRRSASSSELLYEKAMQRFYQAVELDEAAVMAKKLTANPNSHFKTDIDDDVCEYKAGYSVDNRLQQEMPTRKQLESIRHHTGWSDRDIRQEMNESGRKRTNSKQDQITETFFDEDYTESTASTGSFSMSASMESVKSIEKFINSVRSATSPTTVRQWSNDELETYHPRMEVRALSPYRTPEPGQATVILNKPLPPLDPDYVPKPILKWPPNEKSASEKCENNDNDKDKEQTTKSLPATPKPEKEKKSFLQMFTKKTISTENIKKSPNDTNKMITPIAKATLPKANEKQNQKENLINQRQNSMEENKVAIDYYSDLVREVASKPKQKPKIPLYMNNDAMREAAAQAEREEQTYQTNSTQYGSISETIKSTDKMADEDPTELLNVAKRMNQYSNSVDYVKRDKMTSPSTDVVEISVEQTKSISYSLRQIKQPDSISPHKDVFEASAKSLLESTKAFETASLDNGVLSHAIDTKNQETITKVRNSTRSRRLEPKSLSGRQRSQSKSPVSEHKTSLMSTVLKVTRMPINDKQNNIHFELPPSHSPSASPEPRCRTPEQILQKVAETNVRSTIRYTTDLVMFLLACWLYLFRDPRLAIPILVLMVYRRIRNALAQKLQKWTKRKKE